MVGVGLAVVVVGRVVAVVGLVVVVVGRVVVVVLVVLVGTVVGGIVAGGTVVGGALVVVVGLTVVVTEAGLSESDCVVGVAAVAGGPSGLAAGALSTGGLVVAGAVTVGAGAGVTIGNRASPRVGVSNVGEESRSEQSTGAELGWQLPAAVSMLAGPVEASLRRLSSPTKARLRAAIAANPKAAARGRFVPTIRFNGQLLAAEHGLSRTRTIVGLHPPGT